LIFEQYVWNPSTHFIDSAAFKNVFAVINLAGASLANKRWTVEYKQELIESRVFTTRLLVDSINSLTQKPSLFISSSGIGIYGHRPDEKLTEGSSVSKSGFIPLLCNDWENATKSICNEIRSIIIRTGIVLSLKDGFMAKTRLPSLFGIAPIFGDGSQMQSWIHIHDLCKAILFTLDHTQLQGIINLTSPQPISQVLLSKLMAKKTIGFSIPLPLPLALLKLVIGEIAPSLVESQYILPQKLMDSGFKFDYADIDIALNDLLGVK
jgi:uncharacterized protein (TIGR01777 family)